MPSVSPPSHATKTTHTQGPNVLAVEMQGLDIFDALSASRHGGGQGDDEDGGGSSSGGDDGGGGSISESTSKTHEEDQ